ncbi:MAG: glycosyltransferase [Propionibacteriaceae bacterium]|nr:glycosyltransferase [Propionibacteriaceae bacterium]
MKTVSVVIPVYNAHESLRRCLNSVLSQGRDGVEIIAMNDGSNDDSLEILREYEQRYENVIVVDTPNQGVALTRNRGIDIATGEYLAFVDCDDYIDPDYLNTYLDNLDQDYDIVIGGWRRRDADGRLLLERRLKGSEWETYINIYPWSKVFKRQFLLDNEVGFLDYGIGEDLFFTYSLGAKAKNPRVKVINYVGYTWTMNGASVSNTAHKGLNDSLDILFVLNRVDEQFADKPELLKYYYRRFLVWWLLYSGRKATPSHFVAEHDRVMKWINENNLRSSLTPFSRRLRGERLFERLSVFGFGIIERLHLVPLFAAIYCKGEGEVDE